MKNTYITLTGKLFALPLSALVALSGGCVGDGVIVSDEPGDSDDPDGPGGGDGDTDQPLDATGLYQIDSRFDLVSAMPGTVGDVSNAFIEMTDDPYDPATWLIDTILAEWSGGFIEDLIDGARPFLDGVVHELMLEHAPELVQQLVDIGDQFGQVTREFGISSTLEVGADSGDGMTATHTATGYHFRIDGTEHAYTLDELERDPVAVDGVGFGFADGSVAVNEHSIPLQYGGFLALILEDVIIPRVNPSASSLADLFNEMIDCYGIGYRLYVELGEWMSPDFYQGLCELGLEAGSGYVMNKLVSIDEQAQVRLIISGAARAADQDGDRQIDQLTGGTWNGAIDYAGSMGTLAQDVNTFSGERM
jgi:hypothetical protein